MIATLVRKNLRDIRTALCVIAFLLALFQVLWAHITSRLLGDLAPYFSKLARMSGQNIQDIERFLFKGPAQIIRNLIGGENVNLEHVMDLLSVGYVHPLMQTIFCIWAIGRAAGAIAGEIDRGTMELLLAQPLARFRLVLAHLCVDLLVIPALCLSLWLGNFIGAWLITPIQVKDVSEFETPDVIYKLELGKAKFEVKAPLPPPEETPEEQRERLRVRPWQFAPGLLVVAGLIFALSGFTMYLSSMGRYRWRVMSLAVLIALLQFLVNLLGEMWDVMAPLRPLTIFYYYQPQKVILSGDWFVSVYGLRVPMLAVLFGVGALGYALAFRIFTRRDLPAPL